MYRAYELYAHEVLNKSEERDRGQLCGKNQFCRKNRKQLSMSSRCQTLQLRKLREISARQSEFGELAQRLAGKGGFFSMTMVIERGRW